MKFSITSFLCRPWRKRFSNAHCVRRHRAELYVCVSCVASRNVGAAGGEDKRAREGALVAQPARPPGGLGGGGDAEGGPESVGPFLRKGVSWARASSCLAGCRLSVQTRSLRCECQRSHTVTAQTPLQWLPKRHAELSASKRTLTAEMCEGVGRLCFEGSPGTLAVVS